MWILPAKPPYVQNFWSGYIDTFGGGRGAEGLLKIFLRPYIHARGKEKTSTAILGDYKLGKAPIVSKITDRLQNFGSKLFLNS